jgi:opacity protein-like surface antigen
MMVRSFLVTLVSLSLLAAPAAAAGAVQPADSPRSGWLIEVGDLVSRAWGLVFGDRVGDRGAGDRQDLPDDGISSMSGKDEGEGGSNNDPNG